jgi:isoquinoline 1-oxidoreductase
MKGVKIIREGDLLAALHTDPEMAIQAMVQIKANWDVSESRVSHETIFDYLLENASDEKVAEHKGDLSKGLKEGDFHFEETYLDGYKAHASIETHTATAQFKEDHLTIWASSQTPFGTREALASELDLPLENVHVKQIFLGGGFGGKIYNQQAIEAARLARLAGGPVQVAWTRQEEFMYDRFRPAAVVKIDSSVSKSGKITAWDYKVYFAGQRGAVGFYDIPHAKTSVLSGKKAHSLGTGAWRAPANNTNTFARESQIDIMAHRAGIDPLAFRLMNLKDQQMIDTLKLAANKFGYKSAKQPGGTGVGIALGVDAGTRVALIAEVEVNRETGKVINKRMVCAQEMGQVVNPHGATVQTEGGLTMGLGYALYEDIRFEGGKVLTRNFDTYEFARFSTTPPIECVFVDAMEQPPQGGGEPAIICVGGAIANAIYNACGVRLHQLPMIPERILEELNNEKA